MNFKYLCQAYVENMSSGISRLFLEEYRNVYNTLNKKDDSQIDIILIVTIDIILIETIISYTLHILYYI